MSGAPSVNKQIRLAWRGGIGKDLMFTPPLRDVLSSLLAKHIRGTRRGRGKDGDISGNVCVVSGGGGTSGHQAGGKKM